MSGVNRQGLAELAAACVRTLAGSARRLKRFDRHDGRPLPREPGSCSSEPVAGPRDCRRTKRGDELLAVEIREAVDHLGRILGSVYTDDILDRIFSRFCIGK